MGIGPILNPRFSNPLPGLGEQNWLKPRVTFDLHRDGSSLLLSWHTGLLLDIHPTIYHPWISLNEFIIIFLFNCNSIASPAPGQSILPHLSLFWENYSPSWKPTQWYFQCICWGHVFMDLSCNPIRILHLGNKIYSGWIISPSYADHMIWTSLSPILVSFEQMIQMVQHWLTTVWCWGQKVQYQYHNVATKVEIN